jgi:hypothetical protein
VSESAGTRCGASGTAAVRLPYDVGRYERGPLPLTLITEDFIVPVFLMLNNDVKPTAFDRRRRNPPRVNRRLSLSPAIHAEDSRRHRQLPSPLALARCRPSPVKQ